MSGNPEMLSDTLRPGAWGMVQAPPVSETHHAADGRTVALVHETYKVHTLDSPTRHKVDLESLASFPPWILAARRQQNATQEGWLFWSADGLEYIPETNNHPTLGHAVLAFQPTPEAELWGWPRFSMTLNQTAFRRVIETTIATGQDFVKLENALKWLEVVSGLKLVQAVTKEAVIEDRQNYRVAFESKAGAGSVAIPKELVVEFFPFEGSPAMVTVNMRVEFDWEGQSPVFILEALGAARLADQAAKDAAEWVVRQVNESGEDHPDVYLFKGAHKG